MIRTAILAALALCVASTAEARHHRPTRAPHVACEQTFGAPPCKPFPPGATIKIQMHRDRSAGVVPNPSGCPSRAFCGCGASVRVFGRPIRELFLAANWFKFPRTAPAPGTVAVRRHHVFVLEEHVEGDVWRVFDANSGGRATRIHDRSIAGYVIVDPQRRA